MKNIISKLNERNRVIFDLSIIFLVSILATVPMYIYGIAGGNDMYQHFQFAQTFNDAIKNGDYFPSWAINPNYGYGDISVRFYPPLTYYSLYIFHQISGDWFNATCLHVIFLFFLSGIGVYLWSREWFSHNASLVAAIAFIFIPYHFNQVYQASILAEFTAASFLPFCFLFITRICRRGKLIDMCGLALSFGLLILSHLPTSVIGSIIFLIYSLFSLKKSNFIQTIIKLSISVLGSLLLTAFYWVRMATELDFIKHNTEVFISEYYSYKYHFAFDFLFPFIDGIKSKSGSFVSIMLLVTLGVLVSNLVVYFINARKEKSYPITNVLVITIFSILMVTPVSIPIWEALPIIQKVQFPWRWMIISSLGTVIFIAASFDSVIYYLKSPRRYLSILVFGFLLILIPYNGFRVISHLFYYPKDYFNTVIEKFKDGPSYECWWGVWTPRSTNQEGVSFPRTEWIPGKIVLNNREFTIEKWSSADRTLTLAAGESGQAQFATMYYPHWKATVNGQNVEVTPTEHGMISFPVPEQESQIRVYFEEPNFVLSAYYLSGFSWVVMFCILLINLFYTTRQQKGSTIC